MPRAKTIETKRVVTKKRATIKKTKTSLGINVIEKLQADFTKNIDATTKGIDGELKNLSNQCNKLSKQVKTLLGKQKSAHDKKSTAIQKLAAKRTQGAINQLNRAKAAHKTIINELKTRKQELADSKYELKAAKVAKQRFTILTKLITKAEKGVTSKITKPKKTKIIKSSRKKPAIKTEIKTPTESEGNTEHVSSNEFQNEAVSVAMTEITTDDIPMSIESVDEPENQNTTTIRLNPNDERSEPWDSMGKNTDEVESGQNAAESDNLNQNSTG